VNYRIVAGSPGLLLEMPAQVPGGYSLATVGDSAGLVVDFGMGIVVVPVGKSAVNVVDFGVGVVELGYLEILRTPAAFEEQRDVHLYLSIWPYIGNNYSNSTNSMLV